MSGSGDITHLQKVNLYVLVLTCFALGFGVILAMILKLNGQQCFEILKDLIRLLAFLFEKDNHFVQDKNTTNHQ